MSEVSNYPTVGGMEGLVTTDLTELQRLAQEAYPSCKKYTEGQYSCIVKLNTFVTMEGHLSIHLVINPEGSEKCTRVTVSTM